MNNILGILFFADMAGFIEALTGANGVTSANLWAQITAAAAFLGSVVIFAFGYRVVRKIISGVSKGKAKI